MHHSLTADDFETLPDRRIVVRFADAVRALEIVQVELLTANPLRAAPAFAVLLRDNAAKTSMPQNTYVFQHPHHGELALFTLPRGPDGNGMCYELIFN